MKHVFGLTEPLAQMSPVHIPRGFTQAYIEGHVVADLPARIREAHAAFADRDILLIEGTGHAGVGAVVGLSNATVASMLGAPSSSCRRAASGGRSTRSCSMRAVRAPRRARLPARSSTRSISTRNRGSPGRSRTGWRATGSRCSASCRTGRSCPTRPSPWSSRASTARRSTPGPDLDQVIGGIAIGAMEPEHMLERIGPGTLVIVPSIATRILTLTSAHVAGRRSTNSPATRGPWSVEPLGAISARIGKSGAGHRPHRRLGPATGVLAAIRAPDVRHGRARGHLRRRLRGPRPAGQDAHRRRGKIEQIKALVWQHLFIDRFPGGRAGGPVRLSRGAWHAPSTPQGRSAGASRVAAPAGLTPAGLTQG